MMSGMKHVLPVFLVLILLGVTIEGLYIWHPEWFPFFTKESITMMPEIKEEREAPREYITEDTPYYQVETAYPSRTPLRESVGATADAKTIEILKTFEENEIARFKDNGNFTNLTEQDIEMMRYGDGRKQILKIDYEMYTSSATLSYVFTIYQETLGAHGNTFFRTFTFNSKTGEGLVLRDLFETETPYLETLSTLAYNKLKETLGTDANYIDQGTTAYEDNFQSWYLTGNTLVLLFPPYQVAPYALGSQHVRISFREITLKPEYR